MISSVRLGITPGPKFWPMLMAYLRRMRASTRVAVGSARVPSQGTGRGNNHWRDSLLETSSESASAVRRLGISISGPGIWHQRGPGLRRSTVGFFKQQQFLHQQSIWFSGSAASSWVPDDLDDDRHFGKDLVTPKEHISVQQLRMRGPHQADPAEAAAHDQGATEAWV